MRKAAGGTVKETCRCGVPTIDYRYKGECAHCDYPCPNFPNCLLCAKTMEPDKIGPNGITFAALTIFWKAIDEYSNGWWGASEFNKKADR